MKILHILHRSLPGTHGYAIRSKYIVETQKKLSLDPVVITSPFQSGTQEGHPNPEYINAIPYYRTGFLGKTDSAQVRSSSIWLSALRIPFLFLFAKRVLNIAKLLQPAIIHAHSPFYCGIIGSWVAKKLKLPYVYEMRGIWEGSGITVGAQKFSPATEAIRLLDNKAIRKADSIVVISKGLKREVIARAISKRVCVIPNGVDMAKFGLRAHDQTLKDELGLRGKIVIGYIGSLAAEYEGLEYLIKAMPSIKQKCPDTSILLVGDGRLRSRLTELSETLSLSGDIVFVGRVEHEKIRGFYEIIDICVYPRKRTVATDLVTALKPLEAMACAKAVIGSDVGGMREMISEGDTGILFKSENVLDLSEKCIKLLHDSKRRKNLGRRAEKWVRENRDWLKVIEKYREVYVKEIEEYSPARIPLKKRVGSVNES